jgi:hypothetical protein
MQTKKCLIACRIFEDEFGAVLPEDADLEITWINAGLHGDPEALHLELERALSKRGEQEMDIRILFGTGCDPDIHRLAIRYGAKAACVKNCIEAFCGDQQTELEANRTMIMTPGWIRAWPAIMAVQGWDEVDVRMNLGRYDRILLLDAGINPLSDDELIEFFDLVQIPIEFESLDLGCFRENLIKALT